MQAQQKVLGEELDHKDKKSKTEREKAPGTAQNESKPVNECLTLASKQTWTPVSSNTIAANFLFPQLPLSSTSCFPPGKFCQLWKLVKQPQVSTETELMHRPTRRARARTDPRSLHRYGTSWESLEPINRPRATERQSVHTCSSLCVWGRSLKLLVCTSCKQKVQQRQKHASRHTPNQTHLAFYLERHQAEQEK